MKNVFLPYMKIKAQDKVHSLYSASSMERTMGCPGSIREIKKAPPAQDNIHSIKGTRTHTLLEFLLKEGEHHLYTSDAEEFKKFIDYDENMLRAAKVAVSYIKREYKFWREKKGVKPIVEVEAKLPLNDVVNADCGGTSDVLMYQYFNTLHVMDYKNGKSIVEPYANKQMMTYGLGGLEKHGWDFKDITLTIIQPNAAHNEGAIRSWSTTIKRMERFKGELIDAIEATKKKDAPLVEGKYCYFCPAKDICPVQKAKKAGKLMKRFGGSI